MTIDFAPLLYHNEQNSHKRQPQKMQIRSPRRLFLDFVGEHDGEPAGRLYYLFVAAICFTVVILISLLIIRPKEAGQWGDFFGGMLNPILTFLTFMGLLTTIVLQQKELKETRKELERSANALQAQHDAINQQIFESTFFHLLDLQNSIVNSVNYDDGHTKSKGKSAFHEFWREFIVFHSGVVKRNPEISIEESIQMAYDRFWSLRRNELGHYFRMLYNIIRLIDESRHSNKFFIKLLRAQL